MRDLVGVKPHESFRTSSLKREALLFQRLATWQLDSLISSLMGSEDEGVRFMGSELEWLATKGILFNVEHKTEPQYLGYEQYRTSIQGEEREKSLIHDLLNESRDLVKEFPAEAEITETDLLDKMEAALNKIRQRLNVWDEYIARRISIQLSLSENVDARPVVTSGLALPNNVRASEADLVHIILRGLPLPDDSVPWEQIEDFRSDPDNASKLLALRSWMRNVARGSLTPSEIETEIAYLLDQYQHYMNVHKMKTNVGFLETFVTTTAECAENLVTLKWGKIAKTLFFVKHRRVALMEAELSAPGREIAFIAKTRESFHRKK